MRLAAAVVLAFGLSAVAAQPPDDRAKLADAKLVGLLGVYELKAMEVGGVAAKPEFLKGRRFVVRRADSGSGYLLVALVWVRETGADGKPTDAVKEDALRVRIDPTATPTPVEFEDTLQDGRRRTTHGILRFESTKDGDVLTICAADTEDPADRPAAFKAAKPKEYLMVLRRVQKGK